MATSMPTTKPNWRVDRGARAPKTVSEIEASILALLTKTSWISMTYSRRQPTALWGGLPHTKWPAGILRHRSADPQTTMSGLLPPHLKADALALQKGSLLRPPELPSIYYPERLRPRRIAVIHPRVTGARFITVRCGRRSLSTCANLFPS